MELIKGIEPLSDREVWRRARIRAFNRYLDVYRCWKIGSVNQYALEKVYFDWLDLDQEMDRRGYLVGFTHTDSRV